MLRLPPFASLGHTLILATAAVLLLMRFDEVSEGDLVERFAMELILCSSIPEL